MKKPTERIYECEVKKQFLVETKRVWRWVQVPVSKVYDAAPEHVRCAYCHGAVKVYKRRVDDGPQDHVEHKSRSDSEGCQAGSYFQGTHRRSATPIR